MDWLIDEVVDGVVNRVVHRSNTKSRYEMATF